jgi:polar amino acid transport system substrate-binding protein
MRFAWIDEPPFNIPASDGVTGADAEVMRQVAKMLDRPFVPVCTNFADLLPGLVEGRWDVATAMFVTPERAAHSSFTRPVWALADGLLVRRDLVERVTGYATAAQAGLRLAVLKGQVQHDAALRLGFAPGRIVMMNDYGSAAAAVAAGRVDAYASVALAHRAYLAGADDEGLACIEVPSTEVPCAIGAFACRDPAICNAVDGVLKQFIGTQAHLAIWARFGLGRTELPV